MAPLAGVVALIGIVGVVVSGSTKWVGSWADTALFVQTFAGLIAAPATAAVASWETSRSAKTGADRLEAAAARSQFWVLARSASVAWAWGAAAVMAVLVVASIRTATVGNPGGPDLAVVALMLAMLAMQVAFGVVVGTFLNRLVAPLTTVVVIYVIYFLQVQQPLGVGWRRLFPIIQEVWDPVYRSLPGRLLLASAWCLAVAAFLLMAASLYRSPRRRGATWATGGALLVAVAFGVALHHLPALPNEPLFAVAKDRVEVVCRTERNTRVCAWDSDPAALDTLQTATRMIAATTLPMPSEVVQQGLAQPGAVEVDLRSTTRDAQAVAVSLVEGEIINITPSKCPRPQQVTDDGVPWRFIIRDALLHQMSSATADTVTVDYLAAFGRLTPQQQEQWLTSALSAYGRCQPISPIPR